MKVDLHGLRILNTRPVGQNELLSQAIRSAGGVSIECPVLTIEPLESTARLIRELGCLSAIDQAIFISTNAVKFFFDEFDALVWPTSIKVSAIGEATRNALKKRGVRVDEAPALTGSESLLQRPSMQSVKNQTILLVKGEFGRELIADTLTKRGAVVRPLAVYRRNTTPLLQDAIQSLWRQDAVDVILFTSEQAMHTLFSSLGEQAYDWLRSKPCRVMSERLAKVALQLGIKNIKVRPYEILLEGLSHDNGS